MPSPKQFLEPFTEMQMSEWRDAAAKLMSPAQPPRAVVFALRALAAAALWVLALRADAGGTYGGDLGRALVLYLPLLALAALAAYAAAAVAVGVATFRECPAAAAELRKQIEDAQKHYRDRGVRLPSAG